MSGRDEDRSSVTRQDYLDVMSELQGLATLHSDEFIFSSSDLNFNMDDRNSLDAPQIPATLRNVILMQNIPLETVVADLKSIGDTLLGRAPKKAPSVLDMEPIATLSLSSLVEEASVDEYIETGVDLMDGNQHATAILVFNRVLEREPTKVDALLYKAIAISQQGTPDLDQNIQQIINLLEPIAGPPSATPSDKSERAAQAIEVLEYLLEQDCECAQEALDTYRDWQPL